MSWSTLLQAKITQQYPSFTVDELADGSLVVNRPGLAAQRVDVKEIGALCLRGPKDCNYATESMLLSLAPAKP